MSAWGRETAGRALLALAVLIVLACVSCGSLPKTSYYTLRLPPPPSSNSDPRTSFTLGVERFRAPEMLRDDRIVYYESPTQLNYYQYHRWSSDPATILAEMATRWAIDMRLFAQVRSLSSRESVDYVLKGRVLDFEEVDYEGGVKGRVALQLALLRSRDQKVIWSVTRQAESAVQEKGVAGVVKALDTASQQLFRETIPVMAEHVEREFTQVQGQTQ